MAAMIDLNVAAGAVVIAFILGVLCEPFLYRLTQRIRRSLRWRRGRGYSEQYRVWAVGCLVVSGVACLLPWMTLEFFGETLGGLSMYETASALTTIKSLFATYHFLPTDFTLAYAGIGLAAASLAIALLIVVMWRSLAGALWICGVLNIASAAAWILFIQSLPLYANTAIGGLGIGIGCWLFLALGLAWLYIGHNA
jgi:hypothetical protein